jgi:DNA-directed RNA polymerase subunit K/omega
VIDMDKQEKEINKYTMARIIGARALELAMGAEPVIKVSPEESFEEVARKEFASGKIPLVPYEKEKSIKDKKKK